MRLLVLGLDAATWSLADPLMAAGQMPTLSALTAGGWRASLQSTEPPITPPAWTTIITGFDPARHGVASFCEPDTATGLVAPTCGADRCVRTLFDYLGESGATSGVLNIPWTYPADEWPGFCISGFDAPSLDEAAAQPREALTVLREAAPGYALHASVTGPIEPVLTQIGATTDAALALVRRYPVDVLFLTLMATDTAGHVHWPAEPGALSPLHPLARVYAAADGALQRLLTELNPDTVVVVSDHGMGPTSAVVNFSRPLFDAGLMRPAGSLVQRLVLPGYRAARWLYRRRRRAEEAAGTPRPGGVSRWAPRVDWQASRAHAGTGFGWIDFQGADADGLSARLEELVREAASRSGAPAVSGFRRFGPGTHVPGLLCTVDTEAGYWLCPPILDPREPFLLRDRHHPAFQRAGHRPAGLFAASGPGVARGRGEAPIPARDVTPTLLYLAGVPVPEGLDGAVHEAAIDPVHLSARPPASCRTEVTRPSGRWDHSDADRDKVESRLRELGYLE